MGAETHKFDDTFLFIPPYQKRVTFDMAFHITTIIVGKKVRLVFSGNR